MNYLIFPKSKKGDIPVTILVVGVIAICFLAIFSFIYTLNQVRDSFYELELIEEFNIEIEKNSLNKHSFEKEESFFSPSFDFDWIDKRKVFSIDYHKPVG